MSQSLQVWSNIGKFSEGIAVYFAWIRLNSRDEIWRGFLTCKAWHNSELTTIMATFNRAWMSHSNTATSRNPTMRSWRQFMTVFNLFDFYCISRSVDTWIWKNNVKFLASITSYGSRYSRKDQVKFVEDNL